MSRFHAFLLSILIFLVCVVSLLFIISPPAESSSSEEGAYTGLTFESDHGVFTLSLEQEYPAEADKLSYVLYLQTENGMDALKGGIPNKQEDDTEHPQEEIFSGTCSGEDCTEDQVTHGILKVGPSDSDSDKKQEKALIMMRRFLLSEGELLLGKERLSNSLDLTKEEETWMDDPSADTLDEGEDLPIELQYEVTWGEDYSANTSGDSQSGEELLDRRTSYTRVFREADGRLRHVIQLQPVNEVLSDEATLSAQTRESMRVVQPMSTVEQSWAETFVSPSTSSPQNGRQFIIAGDMTDNAGVRFEDGKILLLYDLSTITGQVYEAHLEVALFRSQGSPYVRVSKITQQWSSTSVYPGPVTTGDYGVTGVKNGERTDRNIGIGAHLINELRVANTGFALEVLNQAGMEICSSNRIEYCKHDAPLLVVYTSDDAPNEPGKPNAPPKEPILQIPTNGEWIRPLNGLPCIESEASPIGVCRSPVHVAVVADTSDPNGWGPNDIAYSLFEFTGATAFTTHRTAGRRAVTVFAKFNEGKTNWRVKSVDRQGVESAWSPTWSFFVDTTPPTVPSLASLPTYTKAVGIDYSRQVELVGSTSSDTLFPPAQLQYWVQYSPSASFSPMYRTPFQQNNTRFEIASWGADGVYGTADDLAKEGTYYFQIGVRDPMGNTSTWSKPVSTTFDAVLPVVSGLTVSEQRFSPIHSSSMGVKDTVDISFRYTERFPAKTQILIYDAYGTLMMLRETNESGLSNATNKTISYTWDGRSRFSGVLPDGPYIVYAQVWDKAGNMNLSPPSRIVVVDNSPALISFSSPMQDYWTNQQKISLKGQVASPHVAGEEDQDVDTFQIQVPGSSTWENISFDSAKLFSTEQTLSLGANTFSLRSTDTVGNVHTVDRTIHSEMTAPTISAITPDTTIKDRKPTITFHLEDPDPIGDGSQRSGIPIGINPHGMRVWLEFTILDTTQDLPYSEQQRTKGLIKHGVNLDPALVGDLTCVSSSGEDLERNGRPAASKVDCTLPFVEDLQPDTTYTIYIEVQDSAGSLQTKSQDFTLSSHIYSTVSSVKEGAIYSSSSPLFIGKASKDATLTIENRTLGRARAFTLSEALDGTGKDTGANPLITEDFTVTCGEMVDIDDRADTPDKEVCTWSTRVLQKHVTTNTDTENTTRITVHDAVGNTTVQTRTYTVNLHAFDLEVDTDLLYFSPNGDGRQDGVLFSQSATNPTDPLNPPVIDTWQLRVKQTHTADGTAIGTPADMSSELRRTIQGADFLPAHTYFTGKADDGNWVEDGIYVYELAVTTSDGITRRVPQPHISLIARTTLLDSVIITNPKTGHTTTQGVITLQGQAPAAQEGSQYEEALLRGDVAVEICVNTLTSPDTASCDMTETVRANEQGFFSTLLVLPRVEGQDKIRHIITAVAYDGYGNQTDPSNEVEVVVDVVDPFKNVYIVPAFTGVTREEDYERFLNGEISIDQIRSVVLKTEVTQHTEAVEIAFADYTDISERPSVVYFSYLATITDQTETNLRFNPFQSSSIKKNHAKRLGDSALPSAPCTSETGCQWDIHLPMKPEYGGIYEVQFTGKKGETLQILTAGLKADRTIPAAPIIMVIEKWDEEEEQWIKLNVLDGVKYTDKTKLRLRGAAEPGSYLEISSGGEVLDLLPPSVDTAVPSFPVPSTGVWEAVVDLSTELSVDSDKQPASGSALVSCDQVQRTKQTQCGSGTFTFIPTSFEIHEEGGRYNETMPAQQEVVIFDIIPPQITKVVHDVQGSKNISPWGRTGDRATYTIRANEKLSYADIKKEDTFLRLMTNIEGHVRWQGNISLNREREGYYNPLLRVVDVAGNRADYPASQPSLGLGDYRASLDNTNPDKGIFATPVRHGGKGAGAGVHDIYFGRLNHHFVTRAYNVPQKLDHMLR